MKIPRRRALAEGTTGKRPEVGCVWHVQESAKSYCSKIRVSQGRRVREEVREAKVIRGAMELRTNKVSEGPDVWMLNSVRVMPVVLGKEITSQELK